MDPKTMFACLRYKLDRHRLTVPNHIKKWLARQRSAEAERVQAGKRKPKSKKPSKGKKEAKYGRMTAKKRVQIETLWRQKYSKAEIARVGGCHRSMIGREIARNMSKKGYRNGKAQHLADRRANDKAAARHKLTNEMWTKAKVKVSDGWTFEQFCERERLEGRASAGKRSIKSTTCVRISLCADCRKRGYPRCQGVRRSARCATGTRRSTATPDAARSMAEAHFTHPNEYAIIHTNNKKGLAGIERTVHVALETCWRD